MKRMASSACTTWLGMAVTEGVYATLRYVAQLRKYSISRTRCQPSARREIVKKSEEANSWVLAVLESAARIWCHDGEAGATAGAVC